MTLHIEPISGRYAHIEIEGVAHRLYWEEAGQGIPLVCLHTAGSDGRQYRALLNDPRITSQFRVLVFDMPRHGKSSPPAGMVDADYRLTSDAYVAQILAFCDAMELDSPVVMGCSIGGRIVLHLAQRYPERFRALIGLQSSAHVAPYYDTQWLDRPDVHGGRICGAIARKAPRRIATKPGGTTCRAAPACSAAICISTRSMVTCAISWPR